MSLENQFNSGLSADRNAGTLVSALLLAVITIETIPLPIPIYIAPATSLGALILLPVVYWHFGNYDRSPLGYAVGILFGYALIHSLVFLAIDYATVSSGFLRAKWWIEQVVALSVGVAVFFVLRVTLRDVSTDERTQYLLLGGLLSVIPAYFSIAWMVTGFDALAIVPRLVRGFAPTGFEGLWRTTGFASEPSHFAFLIVTTLLPAALLHYADDWRRVAIVCGGLLIILLTTLSTTGMLLLVIFVAALTLLSGRWKFAALGIGLVMLGIAVFVILLPHTYMAKQLTFLVTGGWRHSINTRFFSTIGPVFAAFSSIHGFVGYGLGGTAAHTTQLLPTKSLASLAHNSGGTISLKTLVGRIVAELGIPGLAIVGVVFGGAYVQLARMHDYDFSPWNWTFEYRVIAAALVTAVFGHGIGNASFAIPVVWLWLAWIDADSLSQSANRRHNKHPR
ncbi:MULTISPECIES: hypothetical protein [unclassified Haladaptatus]|uniref:hypothetical protein n=1 Tax=unclassified Haladaptatus TaxID=2622732 RepID=UPI00209C6B9D|nr:MULTISPECIES: hypothetical protein [unclassified Haladaptatus]MCO8245162.1 hypothetical protein [Haladaptatus sp. AB643]MCO8253306.1 hypothetical protein [Haladaptatus sp. AB618]